MKIKFSAFETKHLNLKSGSISCSLEELSLYDSTLINALVAEATEKKYNLVSWRVADNAVTILETLKDTDFHFVGESLTFSKVVCKDAEFAPNVKKAVVSDLTEVGQIGERAFIYDRFHSDQRIENWRADALKKAWAINCINYRASVVLVHKNAGINAFCACIQNGKNAVIDLIAVKENSRGLGIGRALLASCEAFFKKKCEKIYVSTQGNNIPSISLYKSSGFKLISKQKTFHLVIR